MTSTGDLHLSNFISEIICSITFPKFPIFIYITSKLSISFNYAKYLKRLVTYNTLTTFTIKLTCLELRNSY